MTQPLQREGGYLLIPQGPGIGLELTPDAAERFPYRPIEVLTYLRPDGSVTDRHLTRRANTSEQPRSPERLVTTNP